MVGAPMIAPASMKAPAQPRCKLCAVLVEDIKSVFTPDQSGAFAGGPAEVKIGKTDPNSFALWHLNLLDNVQIVWVRLWKVWRGHNTIEGLPPIHQRGKT